MKRALAVATILTASATGAAADDTGFFVRGQAGLAYARYGYGADFGGGARGPALHLGLAIGSAVTPRWSLHGELGTQRTFALTRVTADGATSDAGYQLSMIALGAGLGYRPAPALRVGVSGGVQLYSMEFPGSVSHGPTRQSSDLGGYGALELGRDWPVSPRWSVGATVRAHGGWMPHEDYGTVSYAALAASLAVTFQ